MLETYTISAQTVTQTVYELVLQASFYLPPALKGLIEDAKEREQIPLAKQAFEDIIANAEMAAAQRQPICQDCGLTVVFLELGQQVQVTGGDLYEAVNEGVRRAYVDGYLRKSVVADPLFFRKNTGDNTPAIIHTKIVSGSNLYVTVTPKGVGSENMSRIYMLKPADGAEGVINAVVETVWLAGPNPCPPIVLGIGIGGNLESVALASKRALLRREGERHPVAEYAEMEREILRRVNELGVGPGGYGGMTTALEAYIETLPTHIGGMPVAINICCHALRHAESVIQGVRADG
jgi:fumarate hydratase subunit alpha